MLDNIIIPTYNQHITNMSTCPHCNSTKIQIDGVTRKSVRFKCMDCEELWEKSIADPDEKMEFLRMRFMQQLMDSHHPYSRIMRVISLASHYSDEVGRITENISDEGIKRLFIDLMIESLTILKNNEEHN